MSNPTRYGRPAFESSSVSAAAPLPRRTRGSHKMAWVAVAAFVVGIALILAKFPGQGPLAPAPDQEKTATQTAVVAVAKFTDITSTAGITFVHNNGAYGDKLLPETMGGGVAFFDCDNDGDADLLFINSTYWPDRVPS